MAQLSFGMILRDERERKGYDTASVARRLRIRPDILQAIEESDFSRMPPRGYARNMVNAYARFLGLNPTEITNMYLDEAYAEQIKKARENVQPTGFDMSRAATGRRSGERSPAEAERTPRTTATGRVLYVDDNRSRYSGNPDSEAQRLYDEERMHRSTRSVAPGSQYTNFYAGPKAPSFMASRLPLIIGGAVLLILLIVLLFFLFGPKGGADDSIEKVPVTGVDDPTPSDVVPSDDQATPAAVAPTKAVFTYEVSAGQSAYIEIYENGTIEKAETVDGSGGAYDVTGVLKFVTTNPSAVKVYQDGVELELADPNSAGVYEVTVDFPAILAKWQEDNPTQPQTPESGTPQE